MWPTFESIKWFYDIDCYTDEDIATYVELGCITSEQYSKITDGSEQERS